MRGAKVFRLLFLCFYSFSISSGDSVTSIGNSAFNGCSSLTSIVIPYSVTYIGSSAFKDCSKLTSVTIQNGVTSIGEDAFQSCSSLTSVHITDLTAWMNIKFENSRSNPLCNGADLYLNGSLVTDLVIPDSVTYIGDSAFYKCSSLTSIVIPDSVTSIDSSAFDGCSSLTNVTIPGSVTKIDSSAFSDCGNLTSVTFEDIKNWSVVISSGKKKKMNVKNVSKNATNLTQNYCGNEWIKE